MDDHDEALEMLQRLVDEIKDTVKVADKIKKIADSFSNFLLTKVDGEVALTVATVVAARVICETADSDLTSKATCAQMSARVYEFIEMYYKNQEDEDDDDDDEYTVQ